MYITNGSIYFNKSKLYEVNHEMIVSNLNDSNIDYQVEVYAIQSLNDSATPNGWILSNLSIVCTRMEAWQMSKSDNVFRKVALPAPPAFNNI